MRRRAFAASLVRSAGFRANRMLAWGLVTLAWTTSGCGDCRPGGSPVPFRQGESPSPAVSESPQSPAGTPSSPAFAVIEGTSLPDGSREIQVEGASIAVDAGALRAVLPLDLDADGDRDALVVATDANGQAFLSHVRRDGPAFGPRRPAASLGAVRAGCTLGTAALRAIAAKWAVATTQWSCTPQGATTPVIEAPTSYLVSLDGPPRIKLELSSSARPPASLDVQLRATDHDADGHDDIVADLRVKLDEASAPVTLTLAWLDRPAGLTRDAGEPDATLNAQLALAKRAARRAPAEAITRATAILGLYGALCRDGEAPWLHIDQQAGVACRGTAFGSASALAAQALARQGNVAGLVKIASAALDGHRVLAAPDRAAIERALASAPAEANVTWSEALTFQPAPAPVARFSALGFVDDDTLLVRGASPVTYTLSTRATANVEATMATSPVIRDPSGSYAVADLHRTCEGFAASVVDSSAIVEGTLVGHGNARDVVFLQAPPPAGSRCPTRAPLSGSLTSRFSLLGWAPQGLVVADGGAVYVAPLDVRASPTAPASLLATDSAPPAPLFAGAATSSGNAFVRATRAGLLVEELVPARRVSLLRPDAWDPADLPTDVAIAPSLRAIAFARGGHVWVGVRTGAR